MNEYVQQAKDFLKSCNATMEINYVGLEVPNWDTKKHKHATYDCIIKTPKNEMTVHFHASLMDTERNIAPTEYDVLACLQCYEVGELEDFMFDYGYEIKQRGDLKKVQTIYDAVCKEYADVCRCFTEEQIQELAEIQ